MFRFKNLLAIVILASSTSLTSKADDTLKLLESDLKAKKADLVDAQKDRDEGQRDVGTLEKIVTDNKAKKEAATKALPNAKTEMLRLAAEANSQAGEVSDAEKKADDIFQEAVKDPALRKQDDYRKRMREAEDRVDAAKKKLASDQDAAKKAKERHDALTKDISDADGAINKATNDLAKKPEGALSKLDRLQKAFDAANKAWTVAKAAVDERVALLKSRTDLEAAAKLKGEVDDLKKKIDDLTQKLNGLQSISPADLKVALKPLQDKLSGLDVISKKELEAALKPLSEQLTKLSTNSGGGLTKADVETVVGTALKPFMDKLCKLETAMEAQGQRLQKVEERVASLESALKTGVTELKAAIKAAPSGNNEEELKKLEERVVLVEAKLRFADTDELKKLRSDYNRLAAQARNFVPRGKYPVEITDETDQHGRCFRIFRANLN